MTDENILNKHIKKQTKKNINFLKGCLQSIETSYNEHDFRWFNGYYQESTFNNLPNIEMYAFLLYFCKLTF